MNSNGFLIETPDYGDKSAPYGSALLVSEHEDGFFELTIPLEGIPSVFGENETFDYNVLTELAKGVVNGKLEMQAGTQSFFINKSNINRLNELKDKSFMYMVAYTNGVAYTFRAVLTYRLGEVDNGSLLQGEFTLTPSSFGEVLLDCRPHIRQTLAFANSLPKTIYVESTDGEGVKINLSVKNGENISVKAEVVGDNPSNYTVTWAENILTVKANESITAPAYAMVYVTATDTTKMAAPDSECDKYAPSTIITDIEYIGKAE